MTDTHSETTITLAEFLQRLDSHLAARDLDQAKLTLQHAYRTYPNKLELRLRGALINQQQGYFGEAEQHLQQLIQDNPAFIQAKAQLLNTRMLADRLENNAENRELISTVLKRQSHNWPALKAQLLLALFEHIPKQETDNEIDVNIEQTLRTALTAYPNGYQFLDLCQKHLPMAQTEIIFNRCSDIQSPALKLRYAELMIQKNFPERALPLLQQAHEISPEHLPIVRNLLNILLKLNKDDEFEKLLEKSSSHFNNVEESIRFKLRLLIKKGKIQEALAISRGLITQENIEPATINIHIQLILNANKFDDFRYCLDLFENRINPLQRSELYHRLGNYAEALKQAEIAIQKNPPSVHAILVYSQCLTSTNQNYKAIDILEDGIKKFDSILLYRLLIKKLADSGKRDKCIQLIKQLKYLFNESETIVETLHYACMALRSDLGQLSLFKCLAQEYNDFQYHLMYMDILRILGKHKEANQLDLQYQQLKLNTDKDPCLVTALQQLPVEQDIRAIPAACFAWIKADQSRWQFDKWYQRALWGKQANILIQSAFISSCSQKNPDWQQFPIQPLDIKKILALLELKRGLMIASSHSGPVPASMVALKQQGINIRLAATTGRNLEPHFQTSFLTANPHSSIKQLMTALARNEVIASSPDLSHGNGGIELDFMHGKLTLAPIIPRLCYRNRTPSLWMKAYWTDTNDIAIEIKELPVTRHEESEKDFLYRWGRAYLQQLEQQFCDDPANISFHEDWRNWAVVRVT